MSKPLPPVDASPYGAALWRGIRELRGRAEELRAFFQHASAAEVEAAADQLEGLAELLELPDAGEAR